MSTTSNQVVKHYKEGSPNPTGRGGFQDRPQDRNPGHWKSEDSISYQYNRFIRMSPDELDAFAKQPNSGKTMAQVLAYKRVAAAMKSLPDMKEITDRTEGKAFQAVDVTTNGKDLPTPILGGITLNAEN